VAVLVKEMFLEGGSERWSLNDVVKRAAKLRLSKEQINEVRPRGVVHAQRHPAAATLFASTTARDSPGTYASRPAHRHGRGQPACPLGAPLTTGPVPFLMLGADSDVKVYFVCVQALTQLSKQAEEEDSAPVGLIYTKGLLYDTT